ncbi:DinB family protein [Echinicola jeungdonensis]|uniref:DinB family protein n=1 Tax=Echinicola jeungdonensis TaxID=709343 RepID=A0ABV5J6T7_9BACT|nr:DinB family protein [Echinicola jeungdonensis]MDN3669213.1 DinB family protein [Echinicola jeungdonensis]
MKNFIKSLTMLSLIFICTATTLQAQTTMEEFLAKWDNMKAYTLELVEAMPEDKLDFKPSDEARSFRELVMHISGGTVMMSNNFIEKRDPGFDLEKADLTKAELVEMVGMAMDFGKESFKMLTEEELSEKVEVFGNMITRRQALGLIDTHNVHHRGNLVTYLRLNDIKPPQFRAW